MAPIIGLSSVLLSAGSLAGQAGDSDSKSWEAWHLDDLSERGAEDESPWSPFLERSSMSAGLYTLPAGATDRQRPHARDEVYYVAAGRATLEVGEERYGVEPGTTVFVRAAVPHRFVEIESELKVIVVFPNHAVDPEAPAWMARSMSEMSSPRREEENVWNPFFDLPTLRMGIYMLPEAIGGDEPLVHAFDEINLVVRGHGTFHVRSEETRVRPGSIVFVESGADHWFDGLEGDLDVLILWERRGAR